MKKKKSCACITTIAQNYCRKKQITNQILKLNINHSNDEDLDEDFSYLNYLRQVVLYMMRKLEKSSAENQRADNVSEIADTRENDTREQELGYMLSAVRENEGR